MSVLAHRLSTSYGAFGNDSAKAPLRHDPPRAAMASPLCRLGYAILLAVALGACTQAASPPSETPPKTTQKTGKAKARKQPPVRAQRADWKPPKVVMANYKVPAQQQIAEAYSQAEAEHRDLVVYIGANWCTPCKLFLKKYQTQAFAPHLADFLFLKFDRDLHREELDEAGYGKPKMIPHFAIPNPDGRASGQSRGQPIKKDKHFRTLGRKLDALVQAARSGTP